MIKVVVKSLVPGEFGPVTNEALLPDQAAVSAWIIENEAVKAFGKPERWISEDDLSFFGEDKSQAIASENFGGPDEEKKRYKFAAQYTVEQFDVTEQVNQQALNEVSEAYLKETDWYVTRYSETGLAVPADVLQKRSAARAAIVR